MNFCNWKKWLPLSLAGISAILASVVLLGWYIKSETLVRVLPHFTGMQYNTALCLLLLSLSVFLFVFNKKWPLRVVCLFIAFITFFTALQYLVEVSFGIDNFFFTYNLETTMDYPGRMALNTAFCLFTASIALYLLSIKNNFFYITALVLAFLVLGFSLVSLFGYLAGVESLIGWKNFSRMAVNTAFCLVLIALAISLYVILNSLSYGTQIITLPLAAGMLALTTSTILWESFEAQNLFFAEKNARLILAYLRADLEDTLREDIQALKRMAERWEAAGGYSASLWEKDTYNYINNLKAIRQIAILNAQFQIIKNTHSSQTDFLHFLDEKAFQKSLQEKKMSIHFDKTNKETLVFIPLFIEGVFQGVLFGQIDAEAVFEKAIQSIKDDKYLILLIFKNSIITTAGNKEASTLGSPITISLAEDYVTWKLEIFVTKESLKREFWQLTFLIGSGGALLTLLSVAATYLAVSLKMKKRSIELQNEELLAAKKNAEQATLAKSSFLATMSHEIRTPLNAIIGTIQLVEEGNISEEQKKYVSRIRSSSKSLLNLLNDVLDFSKMESGSLKIEKTSYDILDIVKQVNQDLFIKAREKNLDLTLDLPSFPMPNIEVDVYRIQQIISNFINNALKFTEKGFINTRLSYKELPNKQLLIKLEIIDSGMGISKENQEKLFQKFSQIEGNISKKSGGVGLGLSIAKKLVEAMQGTVGVESEEGKGACFWVGIPFDVTPNQPAPPKYSLEGKKIELASSIAKEQEVLMRYLQDWKASVNAEGEKDLFIFSSDLKEKIEGAKKSNKPVILLQNEETKQEGIKAFLSRPISNKDFYEFVTKAFSP